MPELTAENVYGLAVAFTALHPDAVYEPPDADEDNSSQCYYTKGTLAGRPGCLFGQVLTDLGVPQQVLEEADAQPDGVPITTLLSYRLGVEFPDLVLPRVLRLAQCRQDLHRPLREVFTNA